MIFYSSNSVGFTSQVLLSSWGKDIHLDKKFCACHECDTDRTVCRLYLPTNRLSAMLLIRAIFFGSGADFKKACGAEMKKSCIKQLFSFINHAV
ncbi:MULTISPECIES: hypothetical protein [Bacillus amyloliquefaciens group]|uniref:hypothetical protein n=1 Tax=Bacillus amyloliquefaciens group TaxID=1938374 RepID=UPI0021506012|nr:MULTISPECIES: hypothetical protein [Bacillus amyloliquefaciens group]MCR4384474.1 hypothetical protein [Bacillus amyloliquefaciens]